jgi:hypothetical protein
MSEETIDPKKMGKKELIDLVERQRKMLDVRQKRIIDLEGPSKFDVADALDKAIDCVTVSYNFYPGAWEELLAIINKWLDTLGVTQDKWLDTLGVTQDGKISFSVEISGDKHMIYIVRDGGDFYVVTNGWTSAVYECPYTEIKEIIYAFFMKKFYEKN